MADFLLLVGLPVYAGMEDWAMIHCAADNWEHVSFARIVEEYINTNGIEVSKELKPFDTNKGTLPQDKDDLKREFTTELMSAISNKKDIVVDDYHATKRSRADLLSLVRDNPNYRTTICVFRPSFDIITRRFYANKKRDVELSTWKIMYDAYEDVTPDEANSVIIMP